jgi:hypothetical protein
MGYEILVGLFCVVWAALHASVCSHPARVPARAHAKARSTIYRS